MKKFKFLSWIAKINKNKVQITYSKNRIAELYYYCPGCKIHHSIPISGPKQPWSNTIWIWNKSLCYPSLYPSVLVDTEIEGKTIVLCHHILRNGNLIFMNDSNHDLAGKTILL